jgi:hypothetical protein
MRAAACLSMEFVFVPTNWGMFGDTVREGNMYLNKCTFGRYAMQFICLAVWDIYSNPSEWQQSSTP